MSKATDPSSSTYVRPLERVFSGVTILAVGIPAAERAEIAAVLEREREHIEILDEATPSDALERLAADKHHVDCVLSAYDLRTADGIDLLRSIRAEHDSVPFVLLLQDGAESIAAEAVNAGADGYFGSGVSDPGYERLAARIETVVEDYRTRTEMAETTRLLLRLTEYTTDALWMFTADWSETVVVNDAYEAIWKRPLTDLVADPGEFISGVHPDDRAAVQDGMSTLSAGEPTELEFRLDVDDGREQWVSVRAEPVYSGDDSVEYVAGFTRDVTDLKTREQSILALNESTTELLHARDEVAVARTVLDIVESVIGCQIATVRTRRPAQAGLIPVAATDGALAVADVDEVAELAMASPDSELSSLAAQTESTRIEDDASTVLPQQTDIDEMLVVPLGEHGVLNVGRTADRPLDRFERSLLELLGRTATAALDRVERDMALETHRKELEQSNENLQQFAYVASHDLQEPLRMVSSYVDLLETEYGDEFDEEAHEYMSYAVDGANRMQAMIDGLLRYAHVQTRAQQFERVDTTAVVDQTLSSLHALIEETETTVETGSLPTVSGDRNQLAQVFQNLVENAIVYTAETGTAPHIDITATRSSGTATFTVADNGPGIPDHSADDIFEIFSRGGEYDSEGTGIGLSVCQRIVRRHDGELWAESTADGAKFMFTIPTAHDGGRSDD